ncbi:hypothetical protein K0M31_010785 [Melipona bicolor]|uniref:Uncharacterized protein n=1 Tax=Melipona bicolor TaxID=60889 RepID=A0AA40FL40_9HYME|nr:hypothetical protein K0M31_010785 [Melipona bicolor]
MKVTHRVDRESNESGIRKPRAPHRPAVYRFPLRELKNDYSKLFLKWLLVQSFALTRSEASAPFSPFPSILSRSFLLILVKGRIESTSLSIYLSLSLSLSFSLSKQQQQFDCTFPRDRAGKTGRVPNINISIQSPAAKQIEHLGTKDA